MRKLLLFLIFSCFISFQTRSFGAEPPKIIGYYPFWSPDAELALTSEDFPGHLLTHIIYSFLTINSKGECEPSKKDGLNETNEPSVLARLKSLKNRFPKLILMVAIGGWGGSGKFSEIASSDKSRIKFAKSCVSLLEKYSLEGVDIDWEYPVTGGLPTDSKSPDDPSNFVLLLTEFRKELGPKKALSVAVAAHRKLPLNLDVSQMLKHADWLGIMAYDYFGAGSPTTGHHAALFADTSLPLTQQGANAQTAVNLYLSQGANPNQLILGVPFYAHSWSNVSAHNNGLNQPFQGVPKTGLENGNLTYQEVLTDYLPKSRRHFDSASKSA